MLMVTSVSPIAISGETSAIVLERSARFSSTSCMRRFLLLQATAAHQQAELFACRLAGCHWRRQMAVEHHGDAVGDLGEFVEILAGDQHRCTGGCEIEQRLADPGCRTGVDAPRR